MTYMLLFLFACMAIGLWAKPHSNRSRLVLALAIALALLFYISPHRM